MYGLRAQRSILSFSTHLSAPFFLTHVALSHIMPCHVKLHIPNLHASYLILEQIASLLVAILHSLPPHPSPYPPPPLSDVKPYPDLQSTQSDLDQLEKIYSLYKQYKEFQESMSSMLWGDLDITALQKVLGPLDSRLDFICVKYV